MRSTSPSPRVISPIGCCGAKAIDRPHPETHCRRHRPRARHRLSEIKNGGGKCPLASENAMEAIVHDALPRYSWVFQTTLDFSGSVHMDVVHGPNLRGRAKYEHAFNNLRNIVENQLAKSLPSEVIRFVTDHLERNVFYLGKINETAPLPAYPELNRLTIRLEGAAPTPRRVIAFPRYNTDNLVLSIREAAEAFRSPWRARLGLDIQPKETPYAWQSIKAMTRRYAEGFDDGYPLRPASNLSSRASVSLCHVSSKHQRIGTES